MHTDFVQADDSQVANPAAIEEGLRNPGQQAKFRTPSAGPAIPESPAGICQIRIHAPLCAWWLTQDTACVVQEEQGRIDAFGNSGTDSLINRRNALLGLSACAGTVAAVSYRPAAAASAVPDMPEWLRSLVRNRLGRLDFLEGRVVLEMPNRADTGLSVPLTVSVPDSPMTEADHVRSLHVFSTRNPQPLISDYHFTPKFGGRNGLAAHSVGPDPIRLRVRDHERRNRLDVGTACDRYSRSVCRRDLPAG